MRVTDIQYIEDIDIELTKLRDRRHRRTSSCGSYPRSSLTPSEYRDHKRIVALEEQREKLLSPLPTVHPILMFEQATDHFGNDVFYKRNNVYSVRSMTCVQNKILKLVPDFDVAVLKNAKNVRIDFDGLVHITNRYNNMLVFSDRTRIRFS